MKKFIALITLIAILMSGFAFAETAGDAGLADAKSYLYLMYKNQPETTPTDYTVVGRVMIGGTAYPIEWTADSETVKIIPGDDGFVTIDVDEQNPEEISYVLTATLTGTDGATMAVSFNHKVPAALILTGLSYEEIVAAAYTLEDGLAMEDAQRLYGTVTKIDTPWSDEYKNITVTIQIGDLADQPIQCYRLSGEGADKLAVGDAITVEGILKNYKGTIEFDKGCVLVGMGEIVSQQAILDAAYALEDGAAMPASTALTGVIEKIDTAWSDEYKNITVTIICDGKTEQPIMCYRLSGEGADKLAVGDEIAVAGIIKNYKGTIEFDKGCVLIPVESVVDVRTALSGYTLEDGMAQTSESTMTGVISAIDTAWSEDYQNITVTMIVGGMADYPIMCYRLKGEGAKDLAIGDTITVTGTLKNYKGTIEFDSGCVVSEIVKGEAAAEETTEPAAETTTETTETATETTEAVEEVKTAKVTAWKSANVRAGAGMEYAVVNWAMFDEVVTVLEDANGWTKIQQDCGVVGYIHNSLLAK